jgi:hypothetical protein
VRCQTGLSSLPIGAFLTDSWGLGQMASAVFVTLPLADRALALGSSRLVSGYDIGMFERSNKPAQSLKERPQFIWIGKRYRTLLGGASAEETRGTWVKLGC